MAKTGTRNSYVRFHCNNSFPLPENRRCKLLDGNLCTPPAPSIRHQAVSLNIAAALLRHVEARKLGRVLQGPCDVVLSEKTVIRPDILFVKRERRGLIGELSLRGKPDLVIEVQPGAIHEKDCRSKRKICARFEIPEYWAVDPDSETVETLVWSELGYVSAGSYGKSDRVSSPLLPGLNLPLFKIFLTE
jgi:Uma2 family endonuclease